MTKTIRKMSEALASMSNRELWALADRKPKLVPAIEAALAGYGCGCRAAYVREIGAALSGR